MATFNAGAIEATLELDRSPFQQGISLARAQGRRFAQEKFTAKLDADTSRVAAEIARLEAVLRGLGRGDTSVDVDADTSRAHAELARLRARLAALEATKTEHTVDVDTRGARVGIQALIGAAGLIGPALIPGITGATAAVGALTTALGAAAGGLAVLGAGLIGNITKVLGAQKDLTAAQDKGTAAAAAHAAAQRGVRDAARGVADAQRGVAAAHRRVADAQRGVADAERAVGDARRNAARAIAAAEDNLGAAHERVRRAQEALNDARRAAAERLEDMRRSLEGAALDEEGAELAVRRAKVALDQIMADPTATTLARDEAQLAYDQALYRMREVRRERDELQDAWRRESAAGVKGSEEVKQARLELRDAQQGVRDAEEGLAQARADGARSVADARRGVADAERNLADARRGVAEAEQGVADARRRLAEAQRAAAETGAELAAAHREQAAAMAAMSGPAALFLKALDRAKGAWQDFLKATEASSFSVAVGALDLFTKYLPMLAPVADAAAEGVLRLFDAFDKWASGGGMQAVVDFLVEYAPDMIESLGLFAANVLGWLGNIMVAFGPFAREFMDGLVRMSEGWREWAAGLSDSSAFEGFLDFVRETGPLFLDVLGSMWDMLVNIGQAMAPAAVPVLKALRATFDFLAGIDPKHLRLLTFAVAGLMLALGVAPIAAALIGIGSLVAILADAGKRSERFGKLMEDVGKVIGDVWGWLSEKGKELWEGTLKPGLESIAAVLMDDLVPAVKDFWDLIEPVVKWLANEAFNMVKLGLGGVLQFIGGALKFLSGVFNVITGLFTGDWKKLWKGVRQIASGAWNMLVGAAKVILVTGLGKVLGLLWKGISKLFRGGGSWLKGHWDDMLKWIRDKAGAAKDWIVRKITDLWRGLGSLFSRGKDNISRIFGNALGWIRDKAADAVRWLLSKFGIDGDGLFAKLRGIFQRGTGILKDLWNKIREIFSNPVKFVIDKVINNGLIDAFNWISGKVGGPTIKHVPVPRGFYSGGYTGPVDPRTVAGVVHGDEHVIRSSSRRKIERVAPGLLDSMNRDGDVGLVTYSRRHPHAPLPGYFLGGRVPTQTARVSRHSGYPWARWAGDLNGPGEDYGQPVRAWKAGTVAATTRMNTSYGNHIRINHGAERSLYAHLSAILTRVGARVAAGQVIGRVGSTGNSSGPHLHFEVAGGSNPLGSASTGGGGGGGFVDRFLGLGRSVYNKVKAPFEYIGSKLSGPLNALKDKFGNGHLTQLLTGLVGKLKGLAVDKAKSLFGVYENKYQGPFGLGDVAGKAIGGVQSAAARAIVKRMAAARGWTGGQWAALDNLVRRESGWNPRAANPSSSARGLFQKMTSVHGPVERTVEGQARWGFNYIAGRYGSPAGAWAHSQRTGWYDKGGILPPGLSLAFNGTGKHEHVGVLTDGQWSLMRRVAEGGGAGFDRELILELIRAVRESNPVIVQPERDATARELIDALAFELRVQGRGGVHND